MEKFWSKVDKTDTCWLWTGWLKETGYAYYRPNRREPGIAAHRYAFQTVNGPIPQGYDIDHTCRVRNCVNPQHLEAVTHAENIKRSYAAVPGSIRFKPKTHCKRGHAMDDANTYYIHDNRYDTRRRTCRQCSIARSMKYLKAKRDKQILSAKV